MKKLILTLLASATATLALANPTTTEPMTAMPSSQPMAQQQKPLHKKPTHPAFRRSDIVCGNKILGNNENADSLSDICKNYKYEEYKANKHATFIDEHSGEHIACSIKDGEIVLSSCNPIKHK